jgi:large subunit ribosomal protein L24
MNFKTGDKVVVITGKDKGSKGKIIKTLKSESKVVVEGVNVVKKNLKPNANNKNGGIISKEAPIHMSNVMIIDPKSDKGTRIGHVIDKKSNKKVRIAKKSQENLD